MEYPFIVETKSKNELKKNDSSQILFCKCGNKQKSNLTVRRTILKNSENLFEDKHCLDKIKCSNCQNVYDIDNNIYGIKLGQIILVEVSFQRETLEMKNKKIYSLKKNKKYYYFDVKNEEIKSKTIIDSIIYDSESKIISCYIDEITLSTDLENEKKNNQINFFLNGNQKGFKFFHLNDNEFVNSFFEFNEFINYCNLEECYFFIDELLSNSFDYECLNSEKFINNFRISSKIHDEQIDNKIEKFIYQKDLFGTGKLIKKKLNIGDYLNKLIKFSEIAFVFITYPPISSLYKMKSLDFVYDGFKHGFFCDENILNQYNATNASKILEISCKSYYLEQNNKFKLNDYSNRKQLNDFDDGFKLSPILLKKINDTDDALVLHKFYEKNILTKQEIEGLFNKYDGQDIILLFSNLVIGVNLREVRLTLKHFNHILKNKFYEDNRDEWLSIYYDTINSLKLIVELINNKQFKEKEKLKYKNLVKLSENKLFETKSFIKLKELHDEMFAIYRALEDEGKDLLFKNVVKKYKNLNQEINFFSFKVIPNLKELSKEGLVMKHCIYTYLNDITKGGYLAIKVKDLISNEKATLGLKIKDKNLYIQQLKGYENSRATELLIGTVIEFCNKNDIKIDNSILHNVDIQPNPSLEKRMKDYLDKKTSLEKRKKIINN